MLQVKKPFICGACEGFYGKPWSFSQRQELFMRMKRFTMNTYLYAPKDDYKHRLYWREVYTAEEAEELRYLIKSAEDNGVSFVYAISPGLDIVYSSTAELNTLKKKLDQVKGLGCRSFALLFDDIEDDLSVEDSAKFASIADAQAHLTNELFNHLGQPQLFLFCPTEYCSSRSLPTVKDSPYLKTLGLRLDNRIDFFWTGPKVVSRKISVENIEEVSGVMKRPVTIWDNIHANDYDQTRIYLGPFEGRPPQLISHLRGVLTNPNCEFEANFIALHTLAQWSKNSVTRFPISPPSTMSTQEEADMEVEEEVVGERVEGAQEGNSTLTPTTTSEYEPRKALEMAIIDWLPELYKPKSSFGQKNIFYADGDLVSKKAEEESEVEVEKAVTDVELEDKSDGKKIDEDVAMATDEESRNKKSEEVNASTQFTDGRRKYVENNLYWEEVQMICDFFYLPFEHGPTGEKMLNAAKWLVDHFHLVFHPFPDSLQHRFTSAGFYQSNPNPQTTLTNTTAATIATSASTSPDSPITDASTSPPTHPIPNENPQSGQEIKKELPNALPVSNPSSTIPSQPIKPIPTFGYYDDDLPYYGCQNASDWYERAIRFHDGYGDLSAIVDKLVNIPNRELLYELYKYINDIRSNLALVNSYIKWHGIDKRDKELFKSGDQEPWVHRGGLLAEFRRLLPFESSRSNNVYIVRPYYAKDYYSVSSVCLKTYNDLNDASNWLANPPTLLSDCFLGPYLHNSTKYCFVLEDNFGVGGYVMAFETLKLLIETITGEWLADLQAKYPPSCIKGGKMTTTSMAAAALAMADGEEEEGEGKKEEDMKDGKLPEALPATEMTAELLKPPPTTETTATTADTAATITSAATTAVEDEPMSAASSSTDHSRSPSPDSYPKTSSSGIMANFASYGYPSYHAFTKPKIPFTSSQDLVHALHTENLFQVTSLLSTNQYSEFIRKYPSPVCISLSRYKERAAKMLLASVEQALSNSRSPGMHAFVPANHKLTLELYTNLGFQEQASVSEITTKGFVLLYKALSEALEGPTEPPPGVKILGRVENEALKKDPSSVAKPEAAVVAGSEAATTP